MKTVLITGASRGIGRELALAFGRAGYAVGVNYAKEREAAEKVVQEIWEAGNKEADVFPCDVRDSIKVRQMIDSVIVRWKRLDVLVNNAGITRDRTILKMTNGEWNDVIDVNLNGAFWCLREAARVMSKEKHGAIINISSIMAVRGGFGNANYAAAKAGLIALTKGAARELGRFHITVNAVLPGFHATQMGAALDDEQQQTVVAENVLGHTTHMEDLTRLVLEVAQNNSVSGQVFNADSRVISG
jgi:3-oxoacyl-[acyl-carrier protein] reductase